VLHAVDEPLDVVTEGTAEDIAHPDHDGTKRSAPRMFPVAKGQRPEPGRPREWPARKRSPATNARAEHGPRAVAGHEAGHFSSRLGVMYTHRP
jgi:hypothetical protein